LLQLFFVGCKFNITDDQLQIIKLMFFNNLVDIVMPSTPCSQAEVKAMKEFLTLHNFRANIFLEEQTTIAHKNNHEFSSASPKHRFLQLHQALENPNSQIIWCARGGYGCAEIIEYLYSIDRPKKNKIFIGFSDITSLNIFLHQQWQYPTITAPVLIQCAYDKVSVNSTRTIIDLIKGNINTLSYQLVNLKNHNFSQIKGELVGGCVSVIAGNFGCKNQLNWHDKILFLEDEGEDGERLDRYFQQITTIIKETHQRPLAIVLGNFMQGNLHGSPKLENIEIAIERFVKKTNDIPFFQEQSFCLGHSFEMLPLIVGGMTTISDKNILKQNIF